MNKEMISRFYEFWVESENYKLESMAEQMLFNEPEKDLANSVEEKDLDAISNYICIMMVRAEKRGFEKGFCLGALFIMNVMKGGAL